MPSNIITDRRTRDPNASLRVEMGNPKIKRKGEKK